MGLFHTGKALLPGDRVIIDDDFSIQSDYVIASGNDQGIDLGEVQILVFKDFVKLVGDVGDLIEYGALQAELLRKLATRKTMVGIWDRLG